MTKKKISEGSRVLFPHHAEHAGEVLTVSEDGIATVRWDSGDVMDFDVEDLERE